MKTEDNNTGSNNSADELAIQELKKWLNLCLRYWGWILASTILGVCLSAVYVYYQPYEWEVSADVVKKSYSSKSGADILSMLPIENAEYSKVNIEYEKRYFSSQEVLGALADKMNLSVMYYDEKYSKKTHLYTNRPIDFWFDKESDWAPFYQKIYIHEGQNIHSYQLSLETDTLNSFFEGKEFLFGKEYEVNGFRFKVSSFNKPISEFNNPYIVIIKNIDVIYKVRGKLEFDVLGEKNTDLPLIQISTAGPLPELEIDLLVNLIKMVQEKDVLDKNFATQQSSHFVEDQLLAISDSMQLIANAVFKMKTNNKELSGGAKLVYDKIYSLDEERNEIELGLKYCDYLLTQIKDGLDGDILMPESYGISGGQLNNLLNQFIELKLESDITVNRLSKSVLFKEETQEKEEKIASLKGKIGEAILSSQKALSLRLERLNSELKRSVSSANVLLSEEKVLEDYQRLFETHESLYKLLLEKQAEFNLRSASTISDYTLLSIPEKNFTPVSPKKKVIIFLGFLVGFGFPMVVLYLSLVFDYKVRDESDLKSITNLPFIGRIARKETPNILVDTLSRSFEAESYRSFRANIQFLVKNKPSFSLMFTSSVSGEGKSVSSANLANFFASLDKKILLVGADLRRPKLKTFFPRMNEEWGLSNYLSSSDKNIEEYFQYSDNSNLTVLLSGSIPPNPTELLQDQKMIELMDYFNQNFDVVIYDSPPIGIVSDTLYLMNHVDLICYAVRQDITSKTLFKKSINELTKVLDNKVSLFMTDVKFRKKAGYYKYSYYNNDYVSYIEK